MTDTPEDDDPIPDEPAEESEQFELTATTSSYKVLGELIDAGGVGVLGRNTAGSGSPVGVKGTVPNATGGYGLSTPDDVRIEGAIDAAGTDFVVEAGTTATSDATNVVHGHASNRATSGVVGAVVGGGGYDDGSTVDPNWVLDDYATVGGGRGNQAGASGSVVALSATVGGGENNVASDDSATVGGGTGNVASDTETTVGGGQSNTASGDGGTVGGGSFNDATRLHTTVGGGTGNEASGSYATVGGGESNAATARQATVGGGGFNDATGLRATVPGGRANAAGGNSAFAAGAYAAAADDNAFVWNDGSGATDGTGSQTDKFSSSTSDSTSTVLGSNTFNVKTTGGIRVVTAGDNSAVTWIPGGGAGWSSSSTRTAKSAVEPVDPEAVLSGVESMPVSTWEFDDEAGGGVRHMGPMAEDFHDAFEDLGGSDRAINAINADGVAFAAIQGLSRRLSETRSQLDDTRETLDDTREKLALRDERIDRQRRRIGDLEAKLETLEARLGSPGPPVDGDD